MFMQRLVHTYLPVMLRKEMDELAARSPHDWLRFKRIMLNHDPELLAAFRQRLDICTLILVQWLNDWLPHVIIAGSPPDVVSADMCGVIEGELRKYFCERADMVSDQAEPLTSDDLQAFIQHMNIIVQPPTRVDE